MPTGAALAEALASHAPAINPTERAIHTASPSSVTSSKDRPPTAQNGCHPPDGARPSHKVY
jgi:hypothetical protein